MAMLGPTPNAEERRLMAASLRAVDALELARTLTQGLERLATERGLSPTLIRATMARQGIAPMQLGTWWSPDTESDVRPLDDAETQAEVKSFMAWLWGYCLEAKAKD